MDCQRAAPTEGPRDGYDPDFCAARGRRWLLVAAILASALGFIDGTVVAIAMPAMRESFDANLIQAQWINNAYMLTLSALILAGGAAADRFGLVRIFGGGIVLFIAASLVCAAAPTAGIMIAARLIQGVGAALMVPGSLALIANSYPPDLRGRAIGIWAAASAVTAALGPLLGGILLTIGGPEMWRLIFAINLPLGLLAVWLLVTWTARDSEPSGAPLDITGAALATLGLLLIAWGLTGSESGAAAEGAAGNRWSLVVVGLAFLAIFVAVEARTRHPMMPLGLFRHRVFSTANLVTFFLYFALSAVLFFLPMTVVAAWGRTEFAASLLFVPLTVAIALMSGPVGAIADRIGAGWPIIGGAMLVSLSFLVLAAATPSMAFWGGVMPAMLLMGVGMGFVVAPLSTAVMVSVPEDTTGIASGVNNAVARIAGLIAVAAMGGFAAARYAAADGPTDFGASTDTSAEHVAAMNSAFQEISLVVAVTSGLSALIALLALRRDQATAAR